MLPRGSAPAWRGVEGIVSGDRLDESQGESEPDRNGNSSQPRYGGVKNA